MSALSLPDGIYILGGYNGDDYLATMLRFQLSDFTFYSMAPMHVARGTFSSLLSSDGRYIYAIGGFNGQPLDLVERYDLLSQSSSGENGWEIIQSLYEKRFMHASCLSLVYAYNFLYSL